MSKPWYRTDEGFELFGGAACRDGPDSFSHCSAIRICVVGYESVQYRERFVEETVFGICVVVLKFQA